MKKSYVKINLGTIILSREEWDKCKELGLNRFAIKCHIIDEGTSQLSDYLLEHTKCPDHNEAFHSCFSCRRKYWGDD